MSKNRILLFTTLMGVLLTLPLMAVTASYTPEDGIDGYVYSDGEGVAGITIHVYRGGILEGYKFGHQYEAVWLGTDITDENGYFHIAYLYAHDETYVVEAFTPCGIITESVIVGCGNTIRVIFSCAPGTGTPGYWKNHPEAWPVDEITIGGITYTKDEAISYMMTPVKGDKTYTMFPALVAAKLNVLVGNPSSCVDDIIAEADAWMADNPVGSGLPANSEEWEMGEPLYEVLDDYNNGLLCAPARD